MMATKLKQQFYMTRLPDGTEQTYSSPEALLGKAYEYFAWCDKTPWNKSELMKSGERKGETVNIAIGRPYTIVGLCVYCGISQRKMEEYDADTCFAPVMEHVRNIIHQHQIEGASMGIYNTSLVLRLLGLTDKQEELTDKKPKVLFINSANPKANEIIERLKQKLSNKS